MFYHNKDRACLCLNKLAMVELEKVPEYSVQWEYIKISQQKHLNVEKERKGKLLNNSLYQRKTLINILLLTL